jgi:sigma-B regulation protein RsbU (phosphoserine phosphatase)
MEDWIAYSVRGNYANTFQGVAHLGSQVADWVWLLSLFSVAVILLEGVGIWRSVRLGKAIAAAVDDLSVAAGEIAGSNFAWRTAVRGSDQLAELTAHFNDMAIALERNQKAEASRLRLDGELHAARTVQESLYPRHEPSLRNASVAGRTSPARMIGGDLYDFFDLGAGQTGLLCADVSGKGIPAALMMANLQALARAGAGRDDQRPVANPAAFVEKLNRELAGRFGDNRYATLLWCVYEEKKGELAYVGAGHPAPIVIHANGELERLESDGFPVGMFANSCYHSAKMSLRPGSRVVIFTDGVTDAADPAGEEYGETRLLTFCRELEPGLTAGDIAGRLMQAVAAWAGGAEQFDDTTVVVLSVAP